MMIRLFSSVGVVVQHVVVDVNEEDEDIVVHRILSCRGQVGFSVVVVPMVLSAVMES